MGGLFTSFFVVAHEVLADADFVWVHEVEDFSHFLLVPPFEFLGDGEVFLWERWVGGWVGGWRSRRVE